MKILKHICLFVALVMFSSQTATENTLSLPYSFPELVVNKIAYYDVPLSKDLQETIFELAKEYEVPVELILAIIETESQFDVEAIGGDDYGLMQINAVNFEWLEEELGLNDLLDPFQNLKAGIHMLAGHLQETGEINLALMCYNRGVMGARELWSEGIWSTFYSRIVVERIAKYERSD